MKMDSNEKKINYKVLYLVEINNFAFDRFSITTTQKIMRSVVFLHSMPVTYFRPLR